jgi:hypothetical protein
MARGNIRKRPAASDDDEEPEAEEMTLQERIVDARNLIKNRARTKVRAVAGKRKCSPLNPSNNKPFASRIHAASGGLPRRYGQHRANPVARWGHLPTLCLRRHDAGHRGGGRAEGSQQPPSFATLNFAPPDKRTPSPAAH